MSCYICTKIRTNGLASLCVRCQGQLNREQKSTYLEAVAHVYKAPPGKFKFYQNQLEMVVEDLAGKVAA